LDSKEARFAPSGTSGVVGSFAANGLGLFDMAGNVAEWVQDMYSETAYQSGSIDDPILEAPGTSRVYRDGEWNVTGGRPRCLSRSALAPGRTFRGIGFRLAMTP
jgi:formylglycine-generating enzyme required for sulfatase activity